MQRLVSQRLFGILQGYEDVNDHDSGRQRAGAGRRVHRPDRGGAGSGTRPRHSVGRFEHLEPGWAFPAKPRRTGTRRSRPERWTISSLSLDACPSPPKEIWLDVDSTDDLVHGNQEGRHFHGYYDSYCYLPLYMGRPDFVLAVAACERRPGGGHGGGIGVWSAFAIAGPETGVRGDGGFCRDELMTWCEDNGVDYLFGLSRNPRLAERIARQLRKSRRRCLSTGESSRRLCDFRYRTRRSWSRTRRVVAKGLPDPRGLNARFVVTSLGCKRAGAQALYEDLYCARGENRGAAAYSPTGPRPRPANQLRLDFATFASRGGDSEGRPGRHRGGQGAGRNDSDETPQGRRLRSEGSALVFVGLALEGSVRPGPGEPAGGCAASPDLTPLAAPTALFRKPERRPRDRYVRVPDSTASESSATAKVRVSFTKNPCLPTAPRFSRLAGRSENRARNPNPAP